MSAQLGAVRSAALVVRITTLMILLHTFEVLLWAGFFRWKCLPSWEWGPDRPVWLPAFMGVLKGLEC
jgi:hypothetical protein